MLDIWPEQWNACLRKNVRIRRLYWRHAQLLQITRDNGGRVQRSALQQIWDLSRSQIWRICLAGEQKRFWRIDRKKGYLYIVGRGALSRLLGTPATEQRLGGIPGSTYLQFAGHATMSFLFPCRESWYMATRAELQKVTGLSPVVQRRYEKAAGLQVRAQVAVGDGRKTCGKAGPIVFSQERGKHLWTLPNLFSFSQNAPEKHSLRLFATARRMIRGRYRFAGASMFAFWRERVSCAWLHL